MPELAADVARDLQMRAAAFVAAGKLPGAAVGVVYGGDLAWSAGIGLSDIGARQIPQATTLYRIASVTKTFTGTAIMRLCEAGLLHLDDPAVAHVPELRRAASPFGPIETVTIRRMLSHESGLASEPPGTDWSIGKYEGVVERTLERAADIGTRIPSNLQQKYSNLAYQLLGEIVTRASGIPFPRYVNDAILHPLGMSETSFEPLGEALRTRRATGYSPRQFSDGLDPALPMQPVWAEGGLWSCVADLARWVSFQLGAYRGTETELQVLPAARLRDMHKPRYLADDQWTVAWGISWYAVRRDTQVWIQHSGGVPGFSANVCFDPKEQVGAIVLLNVEADAAELAMDLATITRDSVRGTVAAAAAGLVPVSAPDEFRPLLGIYASSEVVRFIRLEWRDGKLTFVDPDAATWRPTLTPTGEPDKFVVEPGFRESGESVIFHRLADGRVASVFLADASFARMDRVLPAD